MLILEPLLGRNGQNICDVPVIARETIRFEFVENTEASQNPDLILYTTIPFEEGLSNNEMSTILNKKHWWWRPEKDDVTEGANLKEKSKNNNGNRNENQTTRDGFIIHNDRNIDNDGSRYDTDNKELNNIEEPKKTITSTNNGFTENGSKDNTHSSGKISHTLDTFYLVNIFL